MIITQIAHIRHALANMQRPGCITAIAMDPAAQQSGSMALLAVGNQHGSIVIDMQHKPPMIDDLSRLQPLVAVNAKAICKALMHTYGAVAIRCISRLACIDICAQLLAAGGDAPMAFEQLCGHYHIDIPAACSSGIAGMQQHVQAVSRLAQAMGDALKQDGQHRISKIEASAVAAIAEIEHHGMPFAAKAWQQLTLQHEAEFAQTASTSARYKTLQTILRHYGQSFLTHVGPDGRIHPTFKQIGAPTGRMACSAPNLQAMIKSPQHRACFCAPNNRVLVIADYNACELRILAELSLDPVFLEAFARGDDVHAHIAQQLFKQPVSKTVNTHLRQIAKVVNFGLIYGMGPSALARTLAISHNEAQALLQRYFTTFPRIGDFLETLATQSINRGFCQSITGRKLDLSTSTNDTASKQRIAKNMPMQSTNADMLKIAIATLRQALIPYPTAYTVHCIHDEIIVECDEAQAIDVSELVEKHMRLAGEMLLKHVPIAVGKHTNKYWTMI